MISKKYIKQLGFKNIEDIYNYIIDSEINGAISQFKELITKLSKEQYSDFIKYINCPQYSYLHYMATLLRWKNEKYRMDKNKKNKINSCM